MYGHILLRKHEKQTQNPRRYYDALSKCKEVRQSYSRCENGQSREYNEDAHPGTSVFLRSDRN